MKRWRTLPKDRRLLLLTLPSLHPRKHHHRVGFPHPMMRWQKKISTTSNFLPSSHWCPISSLSLQSLSLNLSPFPLLSPSPPFLSFLHPYTQMHHNYYTTQYNIIMHQVLIMKLNWYHSTHLWFIIRRWTLFLFSPLYWFRVQIHFFFLLKRDPWTVSMLLLPYAVVFMDSISRIIIRGFITDEFNYQSYHNFGVTISIGLKGHANLTRDGSGNSYYIAPLLSYHVVRHDQKFTCTWCNSGFVAEPQTCRCSQITSLIAKNNRMHNWFAGPHIKS